MSNNLKSLIKNIVIFGGALAFAYYFSVFFGDLYEKLFATPTSILGAVDLRGLVGIPLSFIFFISFLFTAFGGEKKYWWIGVLLIPAAAFELYFDFNHIYFPVALGVIGWFAGFLISKLLSKFHKTDATV